MIQLIESSNDDSKHLSTANNSQLTFSQMGSRIKNYRLQLQKKKLEVLSKSKTIFRLNHTLSLHQRLMLLIQENSIPRIHEIVSVALKHKRGIGYVISKITDAVNGVYSPCFSSKDKKLAFLVLQYGGPNLLDILHRALNFPEASTAYRFLKATGNKNIKSSVTTPPEDFIENFTVQTGVPKFGYMLKLDETYSDSKVRWNPHDNKVYGLCYEHAKDEDLEFKTIENIEHLSEKVASQEIHIPKESMVVAAASNSADTKTQVLAALPTCSKSETAYQSKLIESLSEQHFRKNGAPYLNYSTDGDATRRRIFDSLMSYKVQPESDIYGIVSKLRLMDQDVGKHEETVNFDPKHLCKRLRTYICGNNFKVGSFYNYKFIKTLKAVGPYICTIQNDIFMRITKNMLYT